jgi:hypothetical protein
MYIKKIEIEHESKKEQKLVITSSLKTTEFHNFQTCHPYLHNNDCANT